MLLLSVGYLAAAIGLAWHLWMLYLLILVPQGTQLTIGTTASVIGLELVLVGCRLRDAIEQTFDFGTV